MSADSGIIDLTDSDNLDQYSLKSDDSGRKRVVSLAEGFNERLRVADSGAPRAKRAKTGHVEGVELPQNDMVAPARGPLGPLAGASKPPLGPAAGSASHSPPAVPAAPAPAPAPASPGSGTNMNSVLAQLRLERESRAAQRTPAEAAHSGAAPAPAAARPASAAPGTSARPASAPQPQAASRPGTASAPPRTASVLTWNLWFQEDVELLARMKAVGDIIEREGFPDMLLLQEVTHNMVTIFSQTAWFRRYHCSPVPEQQYFTLLLARRDTVTLPAMQPWHNKDFLGSLMGRGILYTRAVVAGRPLVVGTTHLESPVGPGAQQMVQQRQEQLPQAVRELEAAAGPSGDALLAGDLNWNDSRDGPLRVPPSWSDAWLDLMPDHAGSTWDPVANPMLVSRYKGSRLDRVLVRLPSAAPASGAGGASSGAYGGFGGGGGGGWRLGSIKLVGTAALPGLTTPRGPKGQLVPVLPSDHFGLLVKLLPAEAAPGSGGGRVLGSGPAAAPAPGSGGGPTGGRLVGSGPSAPAGAGGSAGGSSSGGASTRGAVAGAGAASTSGSASTHAPKPPAAAKPLSAGAVAGGGRAAAALLRQQRSQKLLPAAGPAKSVAAVDLSVEDDDDDEVVVCD
ncbi:hypothetical protein HYH03_005057 [Edaphochlamys debaryana]|uniref:Endonuclease/exonuclease/phosphatase domain-containing protein n=1 Tax=Edaphochlamys debaryana TaxID=47281 RepID=A0A835YE04_9CHLO|nr:hypothetical protein HYH03_005057 [Edaphochlamys debaryana]|eukprot:KAG2497060.1 hypothetical protein HYH03_005057 [Edaphochlamys debaryana]